MPMKYLRCRVAAVIWATAFLGGPVAGAEQVDVVVHAAAWNVNATTELPIGLFGVHAAPLSVELIEDLGIHCYRAIEFVPGGGTRLTGRGGDISPAHAAIELWIDCEGDRFYEPLVLRHPLNYEEHCRSLGRRYGEMWRQLGPQTGRRGVVQWWNEAYLNWAERSAGSRGSTIQQQWYDLSRAVEGGPVHIKGWKEPLQHFRWRGLWPVRYEDRSDKRGKVSRQKIVGWNIPVPEGAQLGDTFEAAETRYWREPGTVHAWTIEQHWYPVDPTAVGFWSGRQNLDFYRMTFAPWAEALREANPEVTILAGWDFNYEAGSWQVWTELYRPLLQEFPSLIDGITEHHYGYPPERIQAWYEVGTADAMAITGRWLKNWNTECQGRLDPAVYGRASNASGGSGQEARFWEASYNLADIIGLAARCPDKVGSRTMHNFAGREFHDCGGAWALRLLKPLRGDLLAVDSSDQGVYAVASRRSDGHLVLALYNDRPEARDLRIAAPLLAEASRHRLVRDEGSETLRIVIDQLAAEAGTFHLPLPSREAVLLIWSDMPEPTQTRQRRQAFAREGAILASVASGDRQQLIVHITLSPEDLAGAQRCFARLALDSKQLGELQLSVNEHALSFHRDLTVTDLEVPLTALRPGENVLTLSANQAFLLAKASLILDR